MLDYILKLLYLNIIILDIIKIKNYYKMNNTTDEDLRKEMRNRYYDKREKIKAIWESLTERGYKMSYVYATRIIRKKEDLSVINPKRGRTYLYKTSKREGEEDQVEHS